MYCVLCDVHYFRVNIEAVARAAIVKPSSSHAGSGKEKGTAAVAVPTATFLISVFGMLSKCTTASLLRKLVYYCDSYWFNWKFGRECGRSRNCRLDFCSGGAAYRTASMVEPSTYRRAGLYLVLVSYCTTYVFFTLHRYGRTAWRKLTQSSVNATKI